MIFQYYPSDIKQSIPIGNIALDTFIKVIKNPKPETKQIFEQILIAHENNDLKLKGELKTKLYYFTPCVSVKGARRYDNIQSFTGLLVLDFDKLGIDYAVEFKQYLFDTYSFVIASWLSASKHGVRALVSIPKCTTVGEFKEYYNGIENLLQDYKGFDKAVKNCILPLFLSYDENILFREKYSTFSKRIVPVIQPVIKQYIITDKTNNIKAIIHSAISKISDAGHPILRAAAFALGGYVGAGYVSEDVAMIIIENEIENNSYLKQKSSVYKQTAFTMIKKGQLTPLYL